MNPKFNIDGTLNLLTRQGIIKSNYSKINTFDVEVKSRSGSKSVNVVLNVGVDRKSEPLEHFLILKNSIANHINAIHAYKNSIGQFTPDVYIYFYEKGRQNGDSLIDDSHFINSVLLKTSVSSGNITVSLYNDDEFSILNFQEINYNELSFYYYNSNNEPYITIDENYDFALNLASRVLERQNVRDEKQISKLTSILLEVLPEFLDEQVVSSIAELRRQAHQPEIKQKEEYLGRKSGVDPIYFLVSNYGELIRIGQLTPGDLQNIDQRLYNSVRDRLLASDSPMPINDFFESLKPDRYKGSSVERKIECCATILATSKEEAVKFFGSLRPDRVRHIINSRKSASAHER